MLNNIIRFLECKVVRNKALEEEAEEEKETVHV